MSIKGFTFIEIVVALFILAVIFFPLYMLMQKGNTQLYQSENNIKALNLCSEGLEWLAAHSFEQLEKMPDGTQLGGMMIGVLGSLETDPEKKINQMYFDLKNYDGIIPSGGSEEFTYSSEFGGEGTGSDKGAYHDFQRAGIIEKIDGDNIRLTSVVKWAEMGDKNNERKRKLSIIICRQGLWPAK